jgi:hypothetical protein
MNAEHSWPRWRWLLKHPFLLVTKRLPVTPVFATVPTNCVSRGVIQNFHFPLLL